MSSLYEIKTEYLRALEALEVDEETGEVTNWDAVSAIGAELEEKAENIALYVKNLEALAKAIKEEKAKLADRQAKLERKMENVKRYLTGCMTDAGMNKLTTGKCAISFRKSTAVEITDDTLLPAEYVITVQTSKPDKAAIKKAISGGESVSGAVLIENRNIQIK